MPIIDFFQAGIRRDTAMRAVSSCRFRYDSLTRPVIKELEKENVRLKKLVAELSLDKQMLKEITQGNF